MCCLVFPSFTTVGVSCPFSHCVPFHTVLLDARSLPFIPLDSLSSFSPLLANASSVHMINSPAAHLSPVHAVQLSSEELGQWQPNLSLLYYTV